MSAFSGASRPEGPIAYFEGDGYRSDGSNGPSRIMPRPPERRLPHGGRPPCHRDTRRDWGPPQLPLQSGLSTNTPRENGFIEESPLPHHPHPSQGDRGSHRRDYSSWQFSRHRMSHPPTGRHGSPLSMHEGGCSYHATQSSRPLGPRPDGFWNTEKRPGPREHGLLPANLSPSNSYWDGPDSHYQNQRRGSDLRKNYMGTEERWAPYHRERNPGSYSPSVSSSPSWSPNREDGGGSCSRLPLPSPSAISEDHQNSLQDTHARTNGPLLPNPHNLVRKERERPFHDVESSSQTDSPLLAARRAPEERKAAPPREGVHSDRRPHTGEAVRNNFPNKTVHTASRARQVLQEHSYSKRLPLGFDLPRHEPLATNHDSQFLSPLKRSQTSKAGSSKSASSIATSAAVSFKPVPTSAPPCEQNSTSPLSSLHPATLPDVPSSPASSHLLNLSVMLQVSQATSLNVSPSLTSTIPPNSSASPLTPFISTCSQDSPTGLTSASIKLKRGQKYEVEQVVSSSVLNDNHPLVSKLELKASPEILYEGETSQRNRVSDDSSKHSSAGMGDVGDGQKRTTEVAEKSRSRQSSTGDTRGQTDGSLDGFHLDLDLELTSTSCSSSCGNSSSSEVEEIAEEKSECAEGDHEEEGMEDEEEGIEGEEDYSGLMSSSSDASGESVRSEEWTVTSPEPGKMRFSRLDNVMPGSDGERLSVKQITSNRIQLRNGRVLPPSTLGFFASHKDTNDTSRSDTSRSDASRSPPSLQMSPQSGPLRRSRRLAGLSEDDRQEEGEDKKEDNKMEEEELELEEGVENDGQKTSTPITFPSTSDGLLDSSGESELDLTLHLPDPDPVFGSQPDPKPSPLHYQLPEVLGTPEITVIRRGRGQGKRARGYRRISKKGNYYYNRTNSGSESGFNSDGSQAAQGHCQFYMHEARSRTEMAILQRRKHMEWEVKENEKIQSRSSTTSTTPSLDYVDTLEDSGSFVTTSTTESVYSCQTSSKNSEFSPDLIARCKKISTARSSGDTPLHKVCRTGKYDMVRYLLLVENLPVNVQDNAGWTPLHEATSNQHTRIAELLLQNGADSNTSSRDGTRPIHDAIEVGSMELVKLLISFGADLLVEYGEKTAIEFAMDQNQEEIGEYLKEVIRKKQEKKKQIAKSHAIPSRSLTQPKKTVTKQTKKDKLLEETAFVERSLPHFPVIGYGSDCVEFGDEIDFPLFYVYPIIELSDRPHLPVYNFQISPPDTVNPRRHNFYLMDNLLCELGMTETAFGEICHEVNILEMTAVEFLHRMKEPYFNKQVSVPEKIKSLSKKTPIKFIPLCQKVAQMLDISVENMDS